MQWRQAEECLDALGRFEVEVEENAAWGLKLYRSMMDRHDQTEGGSNNINSSSHSNTAVIRCGAIAVLSKDPQMALEAEKIWHAMVEHDLDLKNVAQVCKLGPNVICATACMAAHAKSNAPHGATRALELLQQLTQLYHTHVHSNAPQPIQNALRPNAVAYETLLDAFSRRVSMADPTTIIPPTNPDDNNNTDNANDANDAIPGAMMAQSLLDQIKFAAGDGTTNDEMPSRKCEIEIVPGIRPTVKMYNIVMAAWARQARATRDPAAAQQAEQLYHELKQSERLEPTQVSQTSVLSALCSVGQVDRATQLLMEMEQELEFVTEHSYTTVLHGWATLGKPQDAHHILVRQLHRYEQHAGQDHTIQPPSVHSFNAVLHAWAKSRQTDAAQKACEILTLMKKISQTSDEEETGKRTISLAPDLITYNTVLDAFRSTTTPSKTTHRQNRAALLGEEDDTMVETLLEDMKALYQREKESATSLEQRTKLEEQMRIGFNSAINVFASRQNQYSGDKAERLLIEMEESVGADLISYNATLKAWAKSPPRSGRPSQRAEALLKRMLRSSNHANNGSTPDLTTYNTVLDCWARSGDRKDAGRKAVALLQHLKDVNLVPNLITYHSAMNVLAKHATPGSAERAESILIQLEQHGTPALLTYCLAVQAWSYSAEEDRLRRARHVLDRMREFFQTQRKSQQDRNVLRNAHNSLLGACAQSQNPKEGLELAVEAFSHVVNSNGVIEADESTFLKFLQACYHHLPATQRDPNDAIYALCTDAFRQACRQGMVSDEMMHYFRHVAPPDTFRAMLQSAGLPRTQIDSTPLTSFRAENLPKEWTQHANWKRAPR
eukprot:scaffold6052_cov46-Attheya_sp.AAC.1